MGSGQIFKTCVHTVQPCADDGAGDSNVAERRESLPRRCVGVARERGNCEARHALYDAAEWAAPLLLAQNGKFPQHVPSQHFKVERRRHPTKGKAAVFAPL